MDWRTPEHLVREELQRAGKRVCDSERVLGGVERRSKDGKSRVDMRGREGGVF